MYKWSAYFLRYTGSVHYQKAVSFMIQDFIAEKEVYKDGLVQDWSISMANTLEILQSCTKPLIW